MFLNCITATSPTLTHLNSTLDGMCTIRAFKVGTQCVDDFAGHYDNRMGGWDTGLNMWGWFQIRNNCITAVFNFLTLVILTFFSGCKYYMNISILLISLVLHIHVYKY